MARKVLVRFVDDLDGVPSADVSTVTFALDGVNYQIDLNEANAARLREGLAEFVDAARRIGGRITRGAKKTSGSRSSGSVDAAAIRQWARQQGHQLSDRGRIPASIVENYRASTATKSTPARGRKTAAAKTAAAAKPSTAKSTATAMSKRGGKAANEKAAVKAKKPGTETTARKATSRKSTVKAKGRTVKAAPRRAKRS